MLASNPMRLSTLASVIRRPPEQVPPTALASIILVSKHCKAWRGNIPVGEETINGEFVEFIATGLGPAMAAEFDADAYQRLLPVIRLLSLPATGNWHDLLPCFRGSMTR